MDQQEVFALLEDASADYLEGLEEKNVLATHLYMEEEDMKREYVLTDFGVEYFSVNDELAGARFETP